MRPPSFYRYGYCSWNLCERVPLRKFYVPRRKWIAVKFAFSHIAMKIIPLSFYFRSFCHESRKKAAGHNDKFPVCYYSVVELLLTPRIAYSGIAFLSTERSQDGGGCLWLNKRVYCYAHILRALKYPDKRQKNWGTNGKNEGKSLQFYSSTQFPTFRKQETLKTNPRHLSKHSWNWALKCASFSELKTLESHLQNCFWLV